VIHSRRVIRSLRVALMAAALGLVHVASVGAEPLAPAGHVEIDLHAQDGATPALDRMPDQATRLAPPTDAERALLYPIYGWPLERPLHDGNMIVNYVDEVATTSFQDYMGGNWTYDGHRGTDISLYDFRAMDRGMHIVSAADGQVTTAIYANLRDRNCAVPDDPTLNYLGVSNGDGTLTFYYHLRANSMTVNLGETVKKGDVLALVGSSGFSNGPHLHFEPADYLSGGYKARDPWNGTLNPLPSLWAAQEPYAGIAHVRIYDIGVTTRAAAGGNLAAIDYCSVAAEGMQQPAVFGNHEPYVAVWFHLQGLGGDTYRVEVRRPNGTLYASVNNPMFVDVHGGYNLWYWSWDGNVTGPDFGTWTAKVLVGGVTQQQTSFVVGVSTVYGPRFTPRSGRSFRLDGTTVQRDTLHHSALGGTVTYSLLNAPPFVTLTDSILTIGPVSNQPTRSLYFQALATDAATRQDTAWYHIVDPTMPREETVSVPLLARSDGLTLAPNRPNPFASATTLTYSVAKAGRVRLAIYDLSGRRVRELLDAWRPALAEESVTWNARDDRGQPVPGGVYFCRLSMGGRQLTRRLIRLD
jgi:murein DD-endopeptidase MepM/ murein hydrolase activator NlpD